MDSNNQIEPCLSRKSSEGKPQIFTTLRNIDLNLLTIFEAVYVHKGIVNAAKVLNLTPSAISQSIQKLRVIFPDPLFIRKGQGVTPTAFAMHLHEYISQGLESILGALDIEYSAAIFLIPICISFDTAEKRRYATYLILNRRFSFEF